MRHEACIKFLQQIEKIFLGFLVPQSALNKRLINFTSPTPSSSSCCAPAECSKPPYSPVFPPPSRRSLFDACHRRAAPRPPKASNSVTFKTRKRNKQISQSCQLATSTNLSFKVRFSVAMHEFEALFELNLRQILLRQLPGPYGAMQIAVDYRVTSGQ